MSERWWWVGVTNNAMPAGQRAAGAIVLRGDANDGDSVGDRAQRILDRSGWSGEIQFGQPFPARWPDPPPNMVERMLGPEAATRLAETWGGGAATPEDIKDAFLDDDARPGDPLFRRKR